MSNELEVRSLARLGLTTGTTLPLVATVCLSLALSDRSILAQPAGADGQPKPRVTIDVMATFLQTLGTRSPKEYQAVLEEARQRFPRGAVLESFPDSVSAQLPKQAPHPLRLAQTQLERDGHDIRALKAVTIFKGGNGMNPIDVIIVMHDTNAVVGVYAVVWGR